MHLIRTIQAIDTTARFQPTQCEMWVSEQTKQTDNGSFFTVQSELTQFLSNGTMKKNTSDDFPVSLISTLITGMDESFQPKIDETALNQLFKSFGYQLVNQPPIPTT